MPNPLSVPSLDHFERATFRVEKHESFGENSCRGPIIRCREMPRFLAGVHIEGIKIITAKSRANIDTSPANGGRRHGPTVVQLDAPPVETRAAVGKGVGFVSLIRPPETMKES